MSEHRCVVYIHMLFRKSPHFNFEKEAGYLLKNSFPHGTGSTPQASPLKSLLMKLNCTSAAERRAEDRTQQGWQNSRLSQKRRNPTGGGKNHLTLEKTMTKIKRLCQMQLTVFITQLWYFRDEGFCCNTSQITQEIDFTWPSTARGK